MANNSFPKRIEARAKMAQGYFEWDGIDLITGFDVWSERNHEKERQTNRERIAHKDWLKVRGDVSTSSTSKQSSKTD